MDRNLTETEVNVIAALGYRVYMSTNPHSQTYCFYSDGQRIAYMQREDLTGALSIGTVHLPNKQTGAGFNITKNAALTREYLDAGFAIAPAWANSSDRASVRKYASLDEFLKTRGSSLKLVAGQE